MPNYSYENKFDLHKNEPEGQTHFNINGFAQRLILTQMQKAAQKCSVYMKQPETKLSQQLLLQGWVGEERLDALL